MRYACVVVAWLLASVGGAQAQPVSERVATSPSLTLPTLVYSASAAADWAATYQALHGGTGHETNPALRWLNDSPSGVVLVGAATDAVGIWAWRRYVGRKHPKLAAVGLYAAAGFRAYLAVRAMRIHHQRLK